MRYGSAVVGGLIAGLIGAVIWAAIVYFFQVEIGWIAWGIGALVGVGVAMACKGDTEDLTGVIAAACALLSVLVGKYAAVYFLVAGHMPADFADVKPQDMIEQRAWEIIGERKAAGKSTGMPNNKSSEEATFDDLPADVRNQARRDWEALGDDDKEAKLTEAKQQREEVAEMIAGAVRGQGFKESFGPFDFLWFFLAAATAYKIGAGKNDD